MLIAIANAIKPMVPMFPMVLMVQMAYSDGSDGKFIEPRCLLFIPFVSDGNRNNTCFCCCFIPVGSDGKRNKTLVVF